MATVVTNKYVVEDFMIGKFDYDTVFIKKDKEVIQIPCKKNLGITKGIEIAIESFDKPIEKI